MSKSIQLKKPDLDIKRVNLLQNEGKLLKQRSELQDKLLLELSSATGDILKNEVNRYFSIGRRLQPFRHYF